MESKGGFPQNSIPTIQAIGRDWGSLRQHENLHIRKSKGRRKERRDSRGYQLANAPTTKRSDQPGEPPEEGVSEGFVIFV
jgi:hypothetical protein